MNEGIKGVRGFANRLLNALIIAAVVLGAAAVISIPATRAQNELAHRVDENAAIAKSEAVETRRLLCDILRSAESKEIQRAVALYCPAATVVEP